jgi:signal transduction histidine kinase
MVARKAQGGEDVRRAHTAPLALALALAGIGRGLVYASSIAARTVSPAISSRRGRLSTLPRPLSAVRGLSARLRDLRGGAIAVALAQERRRLAADVHDLIMQDLALALATARTLADEPAVRSEARIIVSAGERALASARQLVDGLSAEQREPVIEAVESSARSAAGRVELRFDSRRVPASSEPDEVTWNTLVHVGREAVANAIKHAAPSVIDVELEHGDEWRLRIRDDGRGFETTALRDGFGLASMNRHARALGGTLSVRSERGAGTTVEVVLP